MSVTIKDVYNTMSDIAQHIQNLSGTSSSCPYIQQRDVILATFKNSGSYSVSSIVQRLIVIDSLYATNASYNYFSFEDMAEAIFNIGPSEQYAINYFEGIAKGAVDKLGIFSGKYGIRKNALPGATAMSLLSKYAYYLLLNCNQNDLGFPIYDSLVKDNYPKILRQALGKIVSKQTVNKYCIEDYIKDLELLRVGLFGSNTNRLHGMQQFDALDAYLWRVGKVKKGNLSLLFSKSQYKIFIQNLSLTGRQMDSELFDKEVKKLCHLMTSVAILQGIYTYPSAMHALIDHCKQI